MSNNDKFVQGVLVGGVIGVVVGLMLAPDSGEKTREEMMARFHDLQDVVSDKFKEVEKAGKKVVKTARKKGGKVLKSVQKKVAKTAKKTIKTKNHKKTASYSL